MNSREIRVYQRRLLAEFVSDQDYANKNVLDFGCGDAPYRRIIEAKGGIWNGYNRAEFPGGPKINVGLEDPFDRRWDVILCTQMLQYVPSPFRLLRGFQRALATNGQLVLTYATNWPEVETEDLWRFTRSGMEYAMTCDDWTIVKHQRIGTLPFGDELLPFGYGLVATK